MSGYGGGVWAAGGAFDGLNRVLCAAAGALSAGLVVTACLVTASSTTLVGPAGTVVMAARTVVQANGPWVLVPVGVPMVGSGVVAMALALRRHPGAGVVAWAATGLVAGEAVLGMLTIGLFALPAAGVLVAACARAEGQRQLTVPAPPPARRLR